MERAVLVVSPSPNLSRALARAVRRTGYQLVVAGTFEAAKARLADRPGLIITELKLGAYNGLHLALRGSVSGIPAIVVADKAFEHDVEHAGAVWVSPETVVSSDLTATIARVLQGPSSTHPVYPWYEGGRQDVPAATPDTANLPSLGIVH